MSFVTESRRVVTGRVKLWLLLIAVLCSIVAALVTFGQDADVTAIVYTLL